MSQTPSSPAPEFEDVVRPHLDYLYSLAVRLCGNRTVAEDLVQDTLLKAFRGFARLQNRDRPRLWLTRILNSAHYDRFRAEHDASETVSLDDERHFDLFDKIVEEDPFRLAVDGYADDIHETGFAPLKQLIDDFTGNGGTIYVCSPCFKKRALDEAKLVGGAKIVGGATLVEFVSEGAPCVSY